MRQFPFAIKENMNPIKKNIDGLVEKPEGIYTKQVRELFCW
jgi:hypothetical protein